MIQKIINKFSNQQIFNVFNYRKIVE